MFEDGSNAISSDNLGNSVESQAAEISNQGNVDNKHLTQAEVDKIAVASKSRGYNKGVEETTQKYEAKIAELKSSMSQNSQAANQYQAPEQASLTEERVAQIAQEQLLAQQQAAYMRSRDVAASKSVMEAKQKYPDFEDKLGKIDFNKYPNVRHVLAFVEDAGEVVYELVNNRLKLSDIETLAQRDPEGALTEMEKLASSIVKNQKAVNSPKAPAPIGSIKQSSITIDNGIGGKSISDIRKSDILRKYSR